MEAIIQIRELCKSYEGRHALEPLTLSIAAGEIFGLLGPIGSGRSTLFKLLAGMLEPSGGEASIAGCCLRKSPLDVRSSIGYLPTYFGTYEDMRVWEYLEFFAMAYRIPRERITGRVAEVLHMGGLDARRNDYIDTMDPEMCQRLALIKTLLHDPPVLLLDDPAIGFSPAARLRILDFVRELRQLGKTILISSNLIMDLAGLCDRIGVMHRGRMLLEGAADEVLGHFADQRLIGLELQGPEPPDCAAIMAHPAVCQAIPHDRGIVFSMRDAAADPLAIIRDLASQGIAIVAWREHEIQPEGLLERLVKQ